MERRSLTQSPLVSVVVPAFDAEATLRETVESALAQSHRNLEVLIVDDGSRDRTPAMAQELAGRDPRVRLLRQNNLGPAAARNRAIARARGELIATLDADDLWHPQKIAKQVGAIQEWGDRCALVYTWIALLDARGRFNGRYMTASDSGSIYPMLLLYNIVGTPSSALMRRDCVLRAGGFDDKLRGPEDLMLFLSLAERHDVAVIPQLLTGYRVVPGSVSHDFRAMRRAYDQVMTAARSRHPELPASLFRWSQSKFCVQQARKCLPQRPWPAGAMLARAWWHDPLFPLTLPLARRLRQRLLGERDPLVGQPFLPVCRELDHFRAPTNSWLEDRRRAYAAALTIEPPADLASNACLFRPGSGAAGGR